MTNAATCSRAWLLEEVALQGERGACLLLLASTRVGSWMDEDSKPGTLSFRWHVLELERESDEHEKDLRIVLRDPRGISWHWK